MNIVTAEKIFSETIIAYDTIARHFSETRTAPGPLLYALTRGVGSHDSVLDYNCGNGRLIEALPEGVHYTGIDVSHQMVHSAHSKYPFLKDKVCVFDGRTIPFTEASFDWVFAIATFHHVPGRVLARALLKELRRVLKQNGTAVITVWNLWDVRLARLWLENAVRKVFGKSELGWFDFYRPWKDSTGNLITKRYFHMFTRRELMRLSKEAGFTSVRIEKRAAGNYTNYCVILQKN